MIVPGFDTKRSALARATAAAAALFALATPAVAGDIGHYNPGVLQIRDLLVPEEGFYAALYNYYYTTDRLNDSNGNKVRSVTLEPRVGPSVTLNLKTDVDLYAMVPAFIWVSEFKILGARYAALISPTFANSSIDAALAVETGQGRSADMGGFGFGDLLVQPLWLGWSFPNFEAAFAYSFYAPTGKYDTDPIALPGSGTVRAESADNIGFGFWTNQFQASGAWYPWEDKRMAVLLATTWEIHSDKEDFNLTPGQNVTINYGVSQYLPLVKDLSTLIEAGVRGYNSWQVSDDSGSDAKNANVHDNVHAVGGQLGVAHVPWDAALTFHYDYEYAAEDRFQGHVLSLSIAKKF